MILDRDVLSVRNRDAYVFEEPFLIVELDAVLDEEIAEKHILKAGTQFSINQAKLFKNGISGYTTSVVFGSIATDFGEIKFEHIWGNEHSTFAEPNYFTFPKPIWKTKKKMLEKKYSFEQN